MRKKEERLKELRMKRNTDLDQEEKKVDVVKLQLREEGHQIHFREEEQN